MTMKRLIIIVEGDTEKEFVDKILSPYFNSKVSVRIDCFKIKHSKGGLSKYAHLRTDILNSIYEDNVIVTTLIDFYALPHDFPKFEEAKNIALKQKRIEFLEHAIKEEIENSQNRQFDFFIPYIQLHEFEALIFSSPIGIEAIFEKKDADFNKLNKIFCEFQNPEDINENPTTAPSKRLLNCIKGYNKVVHGKLILEEIGIEIIMEKCPGFKEWIHKIELYIENENIPNF